MKAGPASRLLYMSSSEAWPARQYRTPTLRWKLSCREGGGGEQMEGPGLSLWGPPRSWGMIRGPGCLYMWP